MHSRNLFRNRDPVTEQELHELNWRILEIPPTHLRADLRVHIDVYHRITFHFDLPDQQHLIAAGQASLLYLTDRSLPMSHPASWRAVRHY